MRKTSQNCVDGGTGRFMHAVSVRRNAKIEQKLFDSEAYFRIAHPKTVPKFDVSLESMIIDVSTESTKIRYTCVLRGKADAASRSVGIFKSNRTSLFAVVTVSPIEITNSSETNGFGAPPTLFVPLLPSRAINTLPEEENGKRIHEALHYCRAKF